MVEIKLYRQEDIVASYVKSFGINNPLTIEAMQKLVPETSSLKGIIDTLDKYILGELKDFCPSLSDNDAKLALIKMIYLQNKLYQKCDIFALQDKKDWLLNELNRYNIYALPTSFPSKMPHQSITIYNPFLRFREFISHAFRK